MPYIKEDTRISYSYLSSELDDATIINPGNLNYLITRLCNRYLEENKLSYQTINDVVGALEGAKLEFYRRVAAPYEDKKIIENGDVYV